MDNISNLSSNLPPTNPINDQTIKEINSDLTTEFKNAAKSVASLYKLSLQKNSVLRHQGYLDCIDDLLNLIKNDGDIENWALMKKLEFEGKLTSSVDETEQKSSNADLKSLDHLASTNTTQRTIPLDYDFTVSSSPQQRFPPSGPIMSVDRSNIHKVTRNRKDISTNDIQSYASYFDNTTSEDEYTMADDLSNKRRVETFKFDKRPKH